MRSHRPTAPASTPRETPIRRQFEALKAQNPGCLLLFQLGDFYESFEDDAGVVARVCGVTLTSRELGKGDRVALAGVPIGRLEHYLARLIEAGLRVAIAEQVSPPGHGLVEREVTRVVTAGTLAEPGLLRDKENNYLAALVRGLSGRHAALGLAYVDVTTGEFAVTQLEGAESDLRLRAELDRLDPAELLVPEGLEVDWAGPRRVTVCQPWRFHEASARERLCARFGVLSLEGFGCAGLALAIGAAGAILSYLEETNRRLLATLSGLRTDTVGTTMVLDGYTRRNLELLRNSRTGRVEGSLLGALDRTVTPMGGRQLRRWIGAPLLDLDEIAGRLDAIEALVRAGETRRAIRARLGRIGDIERQIGRVGAGTAGPRDLRDLAAALQTAGTLLADEATVLATRLDRRDLEDVPPGPFAQANPAIGSPEPSRWRSAANVVPDAAPRGDAPIRAPRRSPAQPAGRAPGPMPAANQTMGKSDRLARRAAEAGTAWQTAPASAVDRAAPHRADQRADSAADRAIGLEASNSAARSGGLPVPGAADDGGWRLGSSDSAADRAIGPGAGDTAARSAGQPIFGAADDRGSRLESSLVVPDFLAAAPGARARSGIRSLGDAHDDIAAPPPTDDRDDVIARAPTDDRDNIIASPLVDDRDDVIARAPTDDRDDIVGPPLVDGCDDVVALIGTAIAPPGAGRRIRPGFSPELDGLIATIGRARRAVAELEQVERQRTGIKSLKVGYTKVFGYYLEVTRPNLPLVPRDYERKQTLASTERFVTPDLKQHEAAIARDEARLEALEAAIYDDVLARVAAQTGRVRRLASAVARLDVVAALADLADERGYCRPTVDDSASLAIVDGRHPVVEAGTEPGSFIPNDCALDAVDTQVMILTGPNMAGKSTYLRQVALIVMLAQMGSFVPAAAARIGLVDRVFTRVGAQDDIAAGASTFMVEMMEAAAILRHASPRSLIVLDEIGRGTSTFDGLSLARAIVEDIHDRLGARTLFATHFHELAVLAGVDDGAASSALPRLRIWRAAVEEADGEVTFLRRIVPGAAGRSYGIQVARLAGLPDWVTARAAEILRQLEANGPGRAGPTPSAVDRAPDAAADAHRPDRPSAVAALGAPDAAGFAGGLEAAAPRMAEELRALDLATLTPIQALLKLAELRALVD